jgi:glycine/sarcosine N-methyltransferase
VTTDRYASFDYASLINWDERLKREWPFLQTVLAGARRVLDLGSGTGEHARFLAAKGFEVVGIDSSPAMIEKSAPTEGVRFVQGDIREPAAAVQGTFDAAFCLGNVLHHLTGPDDLKRFASGIRSVLNDGAPVVIQLLNYDRIEAKKERNLPISFLEGGIIFLRFMELLPDRRVLFMPTVLRLDSGRDEPVELVATQRVEIRGWRHEEIETAFRGSGFSSIEMFGSFQRAPFEPEESRDLIIAAW